LYPIVPVEDAIANVDPDHLVVVEECPEFSGELLFQTVDDQKFLARWREWISRYLCLNELFMLREFVKELENDGMVVCFAPSTKPILDNYQRWERPLRVDGFTCPSKDDEPGKLHPYQIFTLNRALERAQGPDADDRLFFAGWSAGSGKAQPVSEPVLTPQGWRTMGDLKPGDEVIGSDGHPTRVLGVFPQGNQRVYRVEFNDRTSVRCNIDHLWSVRKADTRSASRGPGRRPRSNTYSPWKTLTTQELLEDISQGKRRWQLPRLQPVQFRKAVTPLSIDPYTLGAFLGDGNLSVGVLSATITTVDEWMVERLGWKEKKRRHEGIRCLLAPRDITLNLREMGLAGCRSWEKFVPEQYLHASQEERLALLQGLMDTDGHCSAKGNSVDFSTTSPKLRDAVADLVRGLGGKATISAPRITKYTNKQGERVPGRTSWRVFVSLSPEYPPFQMPRKRDRLMRRTKYFPKKTIKSIVKDGEEEQVCILVDAADNLYVTQGHTLTHNSLFACAGAQELFNRGEIDVCIVLAYPMVMKPNLAYAAKASFDKTTKLDWCLPEGTKKQRNAKYAADHQVYVLNYERCWADFAALKELTEGRRVLFVMDEAQRVLTHETDFRKMTKTRKHLNRLVLGSQAVVWPMSASVVSHNPLRYRDVFNLAGNDTNNPLGTVTQFERRYASTVRHIPIGYCNEITYYTWNVARLHEVRHRVARKTQSVRKTDPGVREFFKGNQVITIPVQMSKEDRSLYDWVLDRAWDANKEGEPLMGHYRLLRYICNTPLALEASADPLAQELVAAHPKLITNAHCAKLEMFLDQVESIAEQQDKVVAFTHYTNLGLLLLAPEVDRRGINHVLHYGVGQRAAESQAAQHIFKTDPEITLFFSSDAGSHGLNLPEAKYNISYECPYSYDLLMQRSERNNRADSTFDTTTYIYLTENTIEERIYEINEERRKLAAATMGTVETLSYGERSARSEEANVAWMMFGEDKK
jgi:hypothetical protein